MTQYLVLHHATGVKNELWRDLRLRSHLHWTESEREQEVRGGVPANAKVGVESDVSDDILLSSSPLTPRLPAL